MLGRPVEGTLHQGGIISYTFAVEYRIAPGLEEAAGVRYDYAVNYSWTLRPRCPVAYQICPMTWSCAADSRQQAEQFKAQRDRLAGAERAGVQPDAKTRIVATFRRGSTSSDSISAEELPQRASCSSRPGVPRLSRGSWTGLPRSIHALRWVQRSQRYWRRSPRSGSAGWVRLVTGRSRYQARAEAWRSPRLTRIPCSRSSTGVLEDRQVQDADRGSATSGYPPRVYRCPAWTDIDAAATLELKPGWRRHRITRPLRPPVLRRRPSLTARNRPLEPPSHRPQHACLSRQLTAGAAYAGKHPLTPDQPPRSPATSPAWVNCRAPTKDPISCQWRMAAEVREISAALVGLGFLPSTLIR